MPADQCPALTTFAPECGCVAVSNTPNLKPASAPTQSTNNGSCSICAAGQTMGYPSRSITVPGYPSFTCKQVILAGKDTLPILDKANSLERFIIGARFRRLGDEINKLLPSIATVCYKMWMFRRHSANACLNEIILLNLRGRANHWESRHSGNLGWIDIFLSTSKFC